MTLTLGRTLLKLPHRCVASGGDEGGEIDIHNTNTLMLQNLPQVRSGYLILSLAQRLRFLISHHRLSALVWLFAA